MGVGQRSAEHADVMILLDLHGVSDTGSGVTRTSHGVVVTCVLAWGTRLSAFQCLTSSLSCKSRSMCLCGVISGSKIDSEARPRI